MWNLPRPGIESLSLALAGWFLTTEPWGKPYKCVLIYGISVGAGRAGMQHKKSCYIQMSSSKMNVWGVQPSISWKKREGERRMLLFHALEKEPSSLSICRVRDEQPLFIEKCHLISQKLSSLYCHFNDSESFHCFLRYASNTSKFAHAMQSLIIEKTLSNTPISLFFFPFLKNKYIITYCQLLGL